MLGNDTPFLCHCVTEDHVPVVQNVNKSKFQVVKGTTKTQEGSCRVESSYFSGFFLLFPTIGSNSYFFLLFHIFQFSFKGSTWVVVGC